MKTLFGFVTLMIAVCAFAQSPTPPMIVVQAANAPAPAAVTKQATEADATRGAVQALEQMKAANAETLKKQEAVLLQIDELQKAADQIRIFAKRTGG